MGKKLDFKKTYHTDKAILWVDGKTLILEPLYKPSEKIADKISGNLKRYNEKKK